MGRSGEDGEWLALAGAAFVMPIAGLNGKHVWAPDYPQRSGKNAGADRACALALRRVIRRGAMQAPAVCGPAARPAQSSAIASTGRIRAACRPGRRHAASAAINNTAVTPPRVSGSFGPTS